MKHLMRVFVALMLFTVVACEKEDVDTSVLDVNYVNIHGSWKLQEWRGVPLEEGNYLYIVFDRKERSYKIYENFDSMYARLIMGDFTLIDDPKEGNRIEGNYAYGKGDWDHKYIITDFSKDRMVWTVKETPDDYSVYVRCEKVPDKIVEEARAE